MSKKELSGPSGHAALLETPHILANFTHRQRCTADRRRVCGCAHVVLCDAEALSNVLRLQRGKERCLKPPPQSHANTTPRSVSKLPFRKV
eukprot:5490937-Amphidinium_carterae.1